MHGDLRVRRRPSASGLHGRARAAGGATDAARAARRRRRRRSGRTLAERLEKEKLTVAWVQTIADGRQAQLATGAWDLAILDVKLPDGSGLRPGARRSARRLDDADHVHDGAQLRREPARGLRDRRRRVPAEAVSPEGVHHPRAARARPRQRADAHASQATDVVDRPRRDVGRDARRRSGRSSRCATPRAEAADRRRAARRRSLARSSTASGARTSSRRRAPSTTRSSACGRRCRTTTAQLIRSVRGIGYQWAGGAGRGVTAAAFHARAPRRADRRSRRSG